MTVPHFEFERNLRLLSALEAEKYRKLDQYASFLKEKGTSEERKKEYSEVIPTYLKLVDVLLVMADGAPSYQYWVKCTTDAESYQRKIKSLIAIASLEQEKAQASSTP